MLRPRSLLLAHASQEMFVYVERHIFSFSLNRLQCLKSFRNHLEDQISIDLERSDSPKYLRAAVVTSKDNDIVRRHCEILTVSNSGLWLVQKNAFCLPIHLHAIAN